MLAALSLVVAIDPPTVTVDVDALTLPQAQAEQLHGELMTRLVESGHAVGATGAIVVRLTGGGEHVHVEVQHGRRAATRDVRGKGALLRLATIHAALEMLAEQDAVVDPDPVRVAARERSVVVVADAQAQSWVPAVIEALVDAGQVVTPHEQSASTRVCLAVHDGRPTLAAVAVEEPCPTGTASDDPGRDAVAFVSAARTGAPAPAPAAIERDPAPEPTVAPAVVRMPDRPAAPARAPAWTGVLGLGLGAQGRITMPEPLVLVHGDARHRSGALITVRASVAPSVAGSLAVADTFVTAGAGWGRALHARVRFELAAAIGVAIHGYRFRSEADARADVTAELPVTLGIVLAPRLELGLSVLGGVSGRARRHFVDGVVEWSRSRWRVAGLASLRFVIGRKPARASKAGGT